VEDSAEVSSLGKLVARLEDQSATKIEQLRAKLRSGNYSVDAGELSKKVIDSMLGK
jgi:anti-sigma28 factor (negative regulator of flagellin synthesis)